MPDAPAPETDIFPVCCLNRLGFVAPLARVPYGHAANILDADRHTDPRAGVFS
jgi:hypothetical protein